MATDMPRSALKSSDLLRDAQAAPSPRWTNGPIQQRYRPVRPPCEDTTWTPLATAGALQHPPRPWLIRRLEQLDEVSGRVLQQGLLPTPPADHVAAERRAALPEPGDHGVEIVDLDLEPVPPARFGHRAVGHR